MARRFKLRVRGRRNAFGLWQGERTDMWQSGTTPSLAVHFRSNSHTMPNYRVPLTPAIHTAVCSCSSCQKQGKKMLDKLSLKTVSKIAQRVQRECTGYYCGYTFKGQVIGRKYLLKAARSLDYLTDTLEKKTPSSVCTISQISVFQTCSIVAVLGQPQRNGISQRFGILKM